MQAIPIDAQQVGVLSNQFADLSKLSTIESTIVFEFYRIQVHAHTLSFTMNMYMRGLMVVQMNSHIISVLASMQNGYQL